MLNKTKITISAGAFALALLGACSDDKSVAGATVDPDVLAEKDGESAINFLSKPTSTIDLKNGSLSVYDSENGASGQCVADGKSYAARTQVRKRGELEVLSSLEVENYGDDCDSLFRDFKNRCESRNGDFKAIAENCKIGKFSVWCAYNGEKSDSFNSVFDEFSNKVGEICASLSANAESTYGEYQTPSSTSKGSDVAPVSSSANDPVDIPPEDIDKYTQYPSDMGEGGVDVPSTGITVKTLNNYTAQFTDNPAELSFDSHVLAYNGRVPSGCRALDNAIDDLDLNSAVKKIDVEKIGECFPTTVETAKMADYKFDEKCSYYVVAIPDGSQPTGHAITKVEKDVIEITSIAAGGMCALTQVFFDVIFLVEDCEGLINESTSMTHNKFTSTIWACEEGSYSPTKEASAYGEWFRDDLVYFEESSEQ